MPFIRSIQDQLRDIREEADDDAFCVTHIDTCLSSYLQDHHNRDGELLLGVAVTGETTIGDVLHDLAMELSETYLEDGERGGFNYDKASAAISALKAECADRLGNLVDSSLDVLSDDEFNEEHCQAWFLIHWEPMTSD